MLPEPKTETLPEFFGVKEIISIDFHRREKDFFKNYQLDQENKKLLIARYRGASPEDKKLFKQSHCLIPLSIGQPVHYDLHLAATLSLVDDTFKSCTFVLGDTLQRHTLAINNQLSEEALAIKAKTKGDKWLEDSIQLLSSLNIPWKIIRWNTFLEDKDFLRCLEIVKNEYRNNENYQNFFKENINEYLKRLEKRNESSHLNERQVYSQCLRYLQEECAVMMMWANFEESYEFELYSPGRTAAMQATYDRFIAPIKHKLLIPISLRFSRISYPGG